MVRDMVRESFEAQNRVADGAASGRPNDSMLFHILRHELVFLSIFSQCKGPSYEPKALA